jgi:copper chaperone CopZ
MTLPRDINRALIVGVLVAGLIAAIVPDDYFAALLGGGIASMLVMMLVGIPIYVCATASVPIAAALIAKGVSPGAALVFLMTGPATNAATITTVWRTMGRKTAGIYLGTVAGASILAGMLLDLILAGRGGDVVQAMPWMIPGPAKTVAAIALIAILLGAFFRPSRVGEVAMKVDGGKRIMISIGGMSCEHCARSIRRALLENEGVESAAVDFKEGSAIVTGDGYDMEKLKEAIVSLGYSVIGVKEAGE